MLYTLSMCWQELRHNLRREASAALLCQGWVRLVLVVIKRRRRGMHEQAACISCCHEALVPRNKLGIATRGPAEELFASSLLSLLEIFSMMSEHLHQKRCQMMQQIGRKSSRNASSPKNLNSKEQIGITSLFCFLFFPSFACAHHLFLVAGTVFEDNSQPSRHTANFTFVCCPAEWLSWANNGCNGPHNLKDILQSQLWAPHARRLCCSIPLLLALQSPASFPFRQ